MSALQDKFPFDEDFQEAVVSVLLHNHDFLVNSIGVIKSEYFEDRSVSWVYRKVLAFYQKYNRAPEKFELENEFKKEVKSKSVKEVDVDAYEDTIDAVFQKVKKEDYVREEVVNFCRNQELFKEILSAAEVLKSSNPTEDIISAIPAKMAQAVKVGDYMKDYGTFFFRDMVNRIHYREQRSEEDIFPTGIPELDHYLRGGLRRGQLGVVVGGSGSGKSISLPFFGKRNVLDKKKITHVSLELLEAEVAERYDALFSRIKVHDLVREKDGLQQALGWYHKKFGDFNIKFFPAGSVGVDGVEGYLRGLENLGHYTDMLLLDYEDLLKSSRRYDKRYEELASISQELKGLAGKLKIPIWTATQLNREGYAQSVPGAEFLAGAFDKLFEPDVLIIIGRTPKEAAESCINIFLAKNRNGPDKVTIRLKTAYEKMLFCSVTDTPWSFAEEDPKVDPEEEENKPKRRRIKRTKK